ncbi:MAG: hypothetical protein J07HB67_00276, partial [halophilic archaeon J07HB67]
MELTASTTPQAIRERFGVGEDELLRESERRRRYLQTYARLLTTVRPTVRFSADLRTAVTDHGDAPEITVTTRGFDQPVTALRRPVFDLAIQEALVIHEIGHLRYTDIEGFQKSLAAVDPDRRRSFARIWNTLEDGAVERQLRARYAVATELDVLNANLLHTPSGNTRRLGLLEAVLCAIADTAVYDSGRLRRLRGGDRSLRMASLRAKRAFERLLPSLRETVRAVLTEPDPNARNERIWSFWTTFRAAGDETESEGSALGRLLDADGVVRVGDRPHETEPAPTDGVDSADERAVFGKPDDTTGGFGQRVRSASDLDRATVTRSVERQVQTVAGGDDVGTEAAGDTDTDDDRTDVTGGRAGAVGDQTGEGDDTRSTDRHQTDTTADEQPVSYPGAGRPGQSTPTGGTGTDTDEGGGGN